MEYIPRQRTRIVGSRFVETCFIGSTTDMAHFGKVLLAVLAFQACTALPVIDLLNLQDEVLPRVATPRGVYRLPKGWTPLDYNITIQPYFENQGNRSFSFDGTTVIRLRAEEANMKQITLHTNGLNILRARLVEIESNTSIPEYYRVETPAYNFFTYNIENTFEVGKYYEMTFEYRGIIRDSLDGFYRSYYKQGDAIKWFGATQFHPTGARSVFPCFDEPEYKSTFLLTIIRPSSFQKSLSNMPINTSETVSVGLVKETFYRTPVMSTYLLAFIVSEFTAAARTPLSDAKQAGIWARPEASALGDYALENGQELVEAMDSYTGLGYYDMAPNMKLDQAAIPDFSGGAMENWGLVTYREALLMYHPEESSAKYRQQVSSIMAHEIAHMWFGNLVTCHWWSDPWLNEGFATLFQYRLPDVVQDLEMGIQFVPNILQAALVSDTPVLSAPLTNENVDSPAQINAHFGTITYNKGASVLRMIENWIGESTFRAALSTYLKDLMFLVTTPSDLFSALQHQADLDGSLELYPGLTVATVMSSWTSQSGYPLLTVNINYGSGVISITQERMVSYGESVLDMLYQVPITFATKSQPDFDNTKPTVVMSEKNININKGSTAMEWVVLNKKQTGFYRVNYDTNSWEILATALNGDSRTEIHTLNRAQIVDDVFTLARENKTNYRLALDVTQFLELETDYAPWTSAYASLNVLRRRYVGFSTLPKLENHILNLMKRLTEELGYEEGPSDSHLTKIFRANTLTLACQLGQQACVEESVSLYENFLRGARINPNLREHVYCNGLRYGNATHYNFLWNQFLSENVVNEQLVILTALGCTRNEDSLNELLTQTIISDSPIRGQYLLTAFNAALTGNEENVDVVFEFFQNNVAGIKQHYDAQSALVSMIGSMSGSQLPRVKEFVSTSSDLSANDKNAGNSAITNAEVNIAWAEYHQMTIEDWLDDKYGLRSVAVSSFNVLK